MGLWNNIKRYIYTCNCSLRRKGRKWNRIHFEEIMAETFQNLVKDKFTDLRTSTFPTWKNIKRTIPRCIKIKLHKTKEKEKSFKSGQGKMKYNIRREKNESLYHLLSGNLETQKTVEKILLR